MGIIGLVSAIGTVTHAAVPYEDPATTAMLVQILSGVVISAGVAFGIFRRKIMMFFKKLKVKSIQRKIERSVKDN